MPRDSSEKHVHKSIYWRTSVYEYILQYKEENDLSLSQAANVLMKELIAVRETKEVRYDLDKIFKP
jgi:hypothetical protein